jgi:hypothetical protein
MVALSLSVRHADCAAAAADVELLIALAAGVVPFVWVAGIVFEYWLALLIVMAGSAVGMSLQYWLAR